MFMLLFEHCESVQPNLFKLETSHTVILPPYGECSFVSHNIGPIKVGNCLKASK